MLPVEQLMVCLVMQSRVRHGVIAGGTNNISCQASPYLEQPFAPPVPVPVPHPVPKLHEHLRGKHASYVNVCLFVRAKEATTTQSLSDRFTASVLAQGLKCLHYYYYYSHYF